MIVAEKLAKGYQEKLSSDQVKVEDGPSSAHIPGQGRWDLGVYNETLGFLITSKNRGRLNFNRISVGSPEWNQAIQEGILLMIELVSDYGFTVRVVLNAELSTQEQDEWVSRIAWKLKVPCGRLVVAAGDPYLRPAEMDHEFIQESVRFLEIPQGDFKVELYCYLTSQDGEMCLEQTLTGESIKNYFERTRPGRSFLQKEECIDFLLRLSPFQDSSLPMPALGPNGAFSFLQGETRLPTLCPLGIPAVDVIDVPRINSVEKDSDELTLHGEYFGGSPAILINKKKASPSFPRESTAQKIVLKGTAKELGLRTNNRIQVMNHNLISEPYELHLSNEGKVVKKIETVPVYTKIQILERSLIIGGPVRQPLSRMVEVYRLPRLCNRWAFPEIVVQLPKGASFAVPDSEKWASHLEANRFRIGFVFGHNLLPILQQLGKILEDLPSGSILELVTKYIEGMQRDGLHRYYGPVEDKMWFISETYPRVTAEVLREAISFARIMETGEPIVAKKR